MHASRGASARAAGDGAEGPAPAEAAAAPGRHRWVPVATFVAGAVLGAAVLGLAGSSGPTGTVEGGGEPSPAVAPEPADAALVRVPAACVEAAEFAETVSESLDEITGAVQDLDARRLQETLDAIQRRHPDVEAASLECRELAAAGTIVTAPPPTPTRTATPTPTGPAPTEPTPSPTAP